MSYSKPLNHLSEWFPCVLGICCAVVERLTYHRTVQLTFLGKICWLKLLFIWGCFLRPRNENSKLIILFEWRIKLLKIMRWSSYLVSLVFWVYWLMNVRWWPQSSRLHIRVRNSDSFVVVSLPSVMKSCAQCRVSSKCSFSSSFLFALW